MTEENGYKIAAIVAFLAIVPACVYASIFLTLEQRFDFILTWLFWCNVVPLLALTLLVMVAVSVWLYKKLKRVSK